jgi:arabinose-5-phosphate isomerase
LTELASAQRTLELEASAILRASAALDSNFLVAVGFLAEAQRIVCTGIGKSGHIAHKVAATMASLGSPAIFVHAAEAAHGDLGQLRRGDALLAFSKSGDTHELAAIIMFAQRFDLVLVGVTSGPASMLARHATPGCAILFPDEPEITDPIPAPTTSTIVQLAIGDALAVEVSRRRGVTPGDFHAFHPGGALGALLSSKRN